MRVVVFGWGVGMGVLGLIGVLFFGFVDPESPALLFGTAGVMAALALFLALSGRDRNDPGVTKAFPDISPPIPWIGVGAVFAVLGAELGWWLSLIGGGMAAVGIGGLVREWRAQKEAYERAVERHGAGVGPRRE